MTLNRGGREEQKREKEREKKERERAGKSGQTGVHPPHTCSPPRCFHWMNAVCVCVCIVVLACVVKCVALLRDCSAFFKAHTTISSRGLLA